MKDLIYEMVIIVFTLSYGFMMKTYGNIYITTKGSDRRETTVN